jgi:hypothetical protein
MVKIMQPVRDKMGMTKKTIIAATIALMTLPTIADAGTITIRGAGIYTCGTWIKETGNRLTKMQWVLGFITAMNFNRYNELPEQAEDVDLLKNADAPGIELWVTNYCTRQPLKTLAEAAIALIDDAAK